MPGKRTAQQVKDKIKTIFKHQQPKVKFKLDNVKVENEQNDDELNDEEKIESEIEAMIDDKLNTSFDKQPEETLHHFSDHSYKSKKHKQQNWMNSDNFTIFYENKYDFSQSKPTLDFHYLNRQKHHIQQNW